MDTIKEIIQISAIGNLSKWYKAFVLLLFSIIFVMLLIMLGVLLINGSNNNISFGYLYL